MFAHQAFDHAYHPQAIPILFNRLPWLIQPPPSGLKVDLRVLSGSEPFPDLVYLHQVMVIVFSIEKCKIDRIHH